ncbi:MAG TPA: glycosyltransferase family 39 protein [Pyrinomonadaceae bacterium]|jgi:4-amino-4-deoxy-L-arabinose transferase-like glycosyltransferase
MKGLKGKAALCLVSILFVGAFFRFYGLRIGFPFEFHVDEWFIVRSVLEMYALGTFKPPAFDYPSLIYYLLLAGAYIVGLFKTPESYDLHLLGRAVSACFGTATIAVVYLTGRRAYGLRAGLLAAAFYACTVTALRESHYYTTDSVNTFFISLSIYFILRVATGDDARQYLYAAVAIGLAAGSKYNGAFLVVPLVVAHAARASGARRDNDSAGKSNVGESSDEIAARSNEIAAESNEIGARSDKRAASVLKSTVRRLLGVRLLAAALLSLVVFFLTTPYALIDRAAFTKDLTKMSAALSRRIVEANHHYIGTTPYWYYIENLLFWAMGPLLEAASLCGLLYALWRHRRQDIVVVVWLLVYFYVVGGWLNKAVRYTLPMLPMLALLAATMFVELREGFARRGRRTAALVISAFALTTLATSFLYACAYMSIYAHPHTSLQATSWAYANIPQGSTILLEAPTAQERPPIDGDVLIPGGDPHGFDPRRFRFVYLDVPKLIPKDDALEAEQRAELRSKLESADFIIMSMRWYEGLVRSPEASPVIRDYYRSLMEGSSDFEPVRELSSYPRLFGLEIRDDAAELNFRIFDHPKVWIFRRKEGSR